MKSFIVTIRIKDNTKITKRFHVSATDASEAVGLACARITELWEIISLEILE